MSEAKKIEKIDEAMRSEQKSDGNVRWYKLPDERFRLFGSAFSDCREEFRRLPDDPALREPVRHLSTHTSGMRLDFCSDTTGISLRVKLRKASHMFHMAMVGSCGFDLYAGEPGEELFVGFTRFPFDANEYEVAMMDHPLSRKMRNFTLNFPLYSGLESLEIGLDSEAVISPPAPWSSDKPLVVYGSSITQGGCASRPGMSYTAIISRHFNRPVYNFGFSGNGRGEPEVAGYLANIADPALYLLDYEPNTIACGGIKLTLSKFIDILREKHPLVPIIVLSSSHFNREIVCTDSRDIRMDAMQEGLEFQKNEVARRSAAGDKNIYFIDGSTLCGDIWHETTVDGTHQTDLGFYLMAKALIPAIDAILKGGQA